jgi:uroporphyrinogen III methyltransferase/synthase
VDVLALYETVAEPLSARELQMARNADYITFTSSSTVRFFLDAVAAAGGEGDGSTDGSGGGGGHAPWSSGSRIVSIGPVTSEALHERGLRVDVEAERHDVEGVVDAVLADAASTASEPAVP